MLRKLNFVAAVGFAIALGRAAIFPDQIGDFKKEATKSAAVADRDLTQEYGLDTTEQAEYKAGAQHFTAAAWRMRDSTGGMAFFEAIRPASALPADFSKLAVQTKDGAVFAFGNYVFQLTGNLPDPKVFEQVYARLPKLEQSPLPPLMTFLPPGNLIPNSERYIVGPVSLQRFAPTISPSTAAFHLGAEAQLGRYESPKGPMTMVVFEYPTPNIARERYDEFHKISGAVAKRVGTLVAIVTASPDADASERVLAQVKYETNITWNEKVPENPATGMYKLLMSIFIFSGIMVGLCLVAGMGFAAVRIMARKARGREHEGAMTTLGISTNKP